MTLPFRVALILACMSGFAGCSGKAQRDRFDPVQAHCENKSGTYELRLDNAGMIPVCRFEGGRTVDAISLYNEAQD